MNKELIQEKRIQFGKYLSELREAQGISAEALAQTTKISINFIEALEKGQFERLPGEVFGRGFVRSLAKTIGAQAPELTGKFDEAWGKINSEKKSVLNVEIKNHRNTSRNDKTRVKMIHAASIFRRSLALKVAAPISILIVACLVAFAVQEFKQDWSRVKSWVSVFNRKSGEQEGSALQRLKPNAPGVPGAQSNLGNQSLAQKSNTQYLWPVRAMPSEQIYSIASYDFAASHLPSVGADVDVTLSSSVGARKLPWVIAAYEVPVAQEPVKTKPKGKQKISEAEEASQNLVAPVVAEKPSAEEPPLSLVETSSASDTVGQENSPEAMVLDIAVNEPVKIKFNIDGQSALTKDLVPGNYHYKFNNIAELLVYDAGAVRLQFNGRDLGPLGSKGRVRRLSFRSGAP